MNHTIHLALLVESTETDEAKVAKAIVDNLNFDPHIQSGDPGGYLVADTEDGILCVVKGASNLKEQS